MKKTFAILALVFLSASLATAPAQDSRSTIQRAMHDELQRNLDRLTMEKLAKPFFISYSIRDFKGMTVSASMGAIINSSEYPARGQKVRVLVGDYKSNNENFWDMGGSSRNTMLENTAATPLENDYNAIRRSLWLATDNAYKECAESYARKLASLEQQKLTAEEAALEDFCKADKVTYTAPPRAFEFQRKKWEAVARELSGMFRNHPEIQSSEVTIRFEYGDLFHSNTEGTETVTPTSLATIQIFASTQATDGAPLKDALMYMGVTPEDLPDMERIKNDIGAFAANLIALRSAPILEPTYTGPVLFEDQAVGELLAGRLFSGASGLIADRKPVFSNPNMAMAMGKQSSFEDKIDTRVLPAHVTVQDVPSMAKFENTSLVGSYAVDIEGVKPPAELTIVENGMLKTLLCNRTPTPKMKASNGHLRDTRYSSNATGPAVIVVKTTAGKTDEEMRSALLQLARDNGLKYALIARRLLPSYASSTSELDITSFFMMGGDGSDEGNKAPAPVLLYKVDVATGREELVRSTVFTGVDAGALRKIAGMSERRMAYNTLASGVAAESGGMPGGIVIRLTNFVDGMPASFVVPRSVLFEELEVKNEKRSYTAKLPVVESPLSRK